MSTLPTVGGGQKGEQLTLTLTPDSGLKTAIDALIALGTKVEGKLIRLGTGANYQAVTPANGEKPHGRILWKEKTATSYKLTCEIWGFEDGGGDFHPATRVVNFEYSGSPSRGNGGLVYGATYRPIYGDASGIGYVIGIDVPSSGRLDMLL
jgi:hypothetical protein